MQHSLIRDPLFSVRDNDGNLHQLNLAEIFVQLTHNNILSFEALQKHQIQAWQSFLVQTAAMALGRAGISTPPEDISTWQNLLITLADGHESAWNLFVHDLSKPAFMQSPVPEGSLAKAKYVLDRFNADDFDVLITSKNHEIKSSRIVDAQPENWIYTFITLQTMEGFLGRGNYGIVRMNGGFASRPKIGFSPGTGWGEQFNHELNILLGARAELTQGIDGYDANGAALLWLQPWNGEASTQITLAECDPYFIEICRRIRVINHAGTLQFWRASTSAAKINAPKDLKGITKDPWTPIELKGKDSPKAMSISINGYNYRLVQQLLLGEDFQTPLMLEQMPRTKDDWVFIARGMARGQGKTDGLHERIVPIPRRATPFMRDPDQRQILAERSKERVADTEKVRSKVLYASLSTLLGGGESNPNSGKGADRWTRAFEANVDDVFFPDLWASIDDDPQSQKSAWQRRLYDLAKTQLDDAIASAPMPSMRRYKAISAARDQFENSARKQLTALFPKMEKAR